MHYRETDKQDYLCRCLFLLTVANILTRTSGLVCSQKGWWKMGKGPPLTHKRAVSYLPLLLICHLTFCLFVILILLPLQLFTYNLVSYHFSIVTTTYPYNTYEGCPESIQPFWISREPVMWPWCNLTASQRRPYCASVNNHSPVGLVIQQWDAFDWACVLCDRRIHKSPPFQWRF